MPDPSTGSGSPRAESRGDWAPHVRARLSPLRLSPTRENAIVEELSQHLDERYREPIAGGASPDEARHLALEDFQSGDVLARQMASLRQAQVTAPPTPGASTGHVFSDLWRDLRYASRMLRRHPIWTTTATLSLALGIGLNAAVFSVVDWALPRLLPYPASHELVHIFTAGIEPVHVMVRDRSDIQSGGNGGRNAGRHPGSQTLGDAQRLLRELAAESETVPGVEAVAWSMRLPTQVSGLRTSVSVIGEGELDGRAVWRPVSSTYFETVGIPVTAGRPFSRTDSQGAPRVAIVNRTIGSIRAVSRLA